MILYDYHTHTNYSPDSNMPLDILIETCIKNGLKEICITDHLDNPILNDYDIPNYNRFLIELADAKKKYNNITIKFGCELSFSKDIKEKADKIIKQYDFDFIIGSNHECSRIFLGPNTSFFYNKTKKEAFTEYFLEIFDNVNTFDCYNVYGHIDYIYRYSKNIYSDNSFNYFDYKDIIDQTLKVIISKGKGIEINTSGYRYGLNNVHPNIDILKTYKQLGGEILTVGSDSHSPSHIYSGFKEVSEMLKQCNIDYITTFDKQKPTFVKI